jgi:branched-chain amino acid transport system substrate-binding protein
MKGKKIFGFGFISILLLAWPLLAAGAEKTIGIGIVAPLTGSGAPWGIPRVRTVQLEAEQYNAAGGITVGGEKYKLEVFSEDDKFSPSEAVTVTNKLIFKDKVKFIANSNGSAMVLATIPITEPNKVITISSCFTPKALGPDLPYSFRAAPTMGETIGPLFKWIKDNKPAIKKAGLLGPNDESGWSINAEYLSGWRKIGLEVVAEDYFERNTNDFYPVLTRILKNKPDILMLSGGTGDLGLVMKQAKQMGFKGVGLTSAPHDPANFCKVSGKDAAEGFISPGAFIMPGRIQKWHDDFVARWKGWDVMSVTYVDYLDLFVAGVKKANSVDTTKIKDAMETMNFESRLYGPVKFGGKARYGLAHQLLVPVFVSEFKNCQNAGAGLVPGLEPDPPPPAKK